MMSIVMQTEATNNRHQTLTLGTGGRANSSSSIPSSSSFSPSLWSPEGRFRHRLSGKAENSEAILTAAISLCCLKQRRSSRRSLSSVKKWRQMNRSFSVVALATAKSKCSECSAVPHIGYGHGGSNCTTSSSLSCCKSCKACF